MLSFEYIFSGALVGFLIGMTGIGGGALMTPLLILLFGISPSTAVGTDLFFASITKLSSLFFFSQKKLINWNIVKLLSLGSLPISFLVLIILKENSQSQVETSFFLTKIIGVVLIVSSFLYLIKFFSNKNIFYNMKGIFTSSYVKKSLTIFAGIIIGTIVTTTSIGAGVLGTVALIILYPNLSPVSLIATEIAHAVPLALLAGVGHASLGNVDVQILGNLLLGSLPAAYAGSQLGNIVPKNFLRVFLGIFLFLAGIKLIV